MSYLLKIARQMADMSISDGNDGLYDFAIDVIEEIKGLTAKLAEYKAQLADTVKGRDNYYEAYQRYMERALDAEKERDDLKIELDNKNKFYADYETSAACDNNLARALIGVKRDHRPLHECMEEWANLYIDQCNRYEEALKTIVAAGEMDREYMIKIAREALENGR